jgi:hypothetical protein
MDQESIGRAVCGPDAWRKMSDVSASSRGSVWPMAAASSPVFGPAEKMMNMSLPSYAAYGCAAVLLAMAPLAGLCAADGGPAGARDAAQGVLSKKAAVEQVRQRCAAPQDARQWNYYGAAAFIWLSGNADYVYAAEQILAGQPALPAEQGVLDATVSPSACAAFAKRVFDGAEDVTRQNPAWAQALGTYLAKHPVPEAVRAERETRTGCTKSRLNAGLQLDEVSRLCACLGSAFVEATTPAQRRAYWKAVADKDQAETARWLKIIMPAARRCQAP